MLRTRWLALATGIALLTTPGARAIAAVPASDLAAAERRLASAFARQGIAYPPRAVTLIALKAEARLELWADGGDGWKFVRSYLVWRGSGLLGPKLRQGDHQVPEGVYRIEALNPASRYHLSLRLDYPNDFDRARASEDHRERLGGDIMIHGNKRSDGCLPLGDAAVEEIYALTARVGLPGPTVIISPLDLRRVQPSVAAFQAGKRPIWLETLYLTIAESLREFALPADEPPAVTARRTVVARPTCRPYDVADCARRCRKGDAQSCARAGLLYRQGHGVKTDVAKAWTFLRKACAKGDGLGCAELGQLYLADDGPRRDASRAAALAKVACDAGEGHGCRALVQLCAERLIYPVKRDQCSDESIRRAYDRAVTTLEGECVGWGAYDCDTLATIYEDEGDDVRARALYRRACDAGHATACERFAASEEG